jgi:hypothetical protein
MLNVFMEAEPVSLTQQLTSLTAKIFNIPVSTRGRIGKRKVNLHIVLEAGLSLAYSKCYYCILG